MTSILGVYDTINLVQDTFTGQYILCFIPKSSNELCFITGFDTSSIDMIANGRLEASSFPENGVQLNSKFLNVFLTNSVKLPRWSWVADRWSKEFKIVVIDKDGKRAEIDDP